MSNGLRDRFGFAPARARGRPSPAAGAEPGGDGGRRDTVDTVGKTSAVLEVVKNARGINGR